MNIEYRDGTVILKSIECFDPEQIFDNGQAFRFNGVRDVYEGVAHGHFLRVSKRGDDVVLYPCTQQAFERIWRHYFDLERAYASLFCDCADAALATGRSYARGLRVLNQQPFETLVSFVISANNNLKRIKKIVESVCRACGSPFVFEEKTYYAFPEPAQLADMTEERLVGCGCGYRAPYIVETACAVRDGFDLAAVEKLPYEQAKQQLVKLKGVGPKVADCVLLFSMHKTDAFPADVWIKRVMKNLYGFSGNDRQMYEFAQKRFGDCAGIAQQYLFYYARENRD